MGKQDALDLSEFMTDSLSVHSIANTNTRKMFPKSDDNPLAELFKQDPLEVLGEKSFGPPQEVSEHIIGTPIQEFFRNKHVFITGGTGFIGKLLTEKLLRSVPHIGHIYLLIRTKRGKQCQERFEQLFQDKVFSRMKAEVPHYRSKVTAVEGDLSSAGLGLAAEDRRALAEGVHIVFHGAADVRFVEPLRAAVESNVYGTRRVLELAKEMVNIKAFVYVSTAYSQCVRRVVPEAIPKMSISYTDLLEEIQSKTDEEINRDLTRILQGWPNTYTFSKALSEDIVREEAGHIPVCIIRPSAVVCTYKEPVRGYIDNLYGPMGIMLGSTVGLIHCFRLDKESYLNAVPVDFTANCIIAAAWNTVNRNCTDPQVYNFTVMPYQNCWKQIEGLANIAIHLWPFNQTVWYQSFFFTNSKLLDEVAHVFLHKIPGIVFDKIAQIFGEKPRLTRIYNTIEAVKEPLHYFLYNSWEFHNDNVLKLWSTMADEDKELFSFDVTSIDTIQLSMIGKLGMRYYYLKEKMETIPKALAKLKWLRLIHYTLKSIAGIILLKAFVAISHKVPI